MEHLSAVSGLRAKTAPLCETERRLFGWERAIKFEMPTELLTEGFSWAVVV